MPNRKFGAPRKFGTSTKFGASSGLGRQLSFGLLVDWDDDGLFDGYNEASGRMVSYSIQRGREFFINDSDDGFEPVRAGELTVTLLDLDGRYNPFNLSSPLVGLLNKNQKIRLSVMDEATETEYYRFTGFIEDIRPNFDPVSPSVTITAKDGIEKLKNTTIKSSAVQTSVQYDNMIAEDLSLAGWMGGTSIDTTASDQLTYYWARGNAAFTEIMELVNAVRGIFFVDAAGVATYLSIYSSNSPVVSLTEADILHEYGIHVPAPREVVRNLIRIYAKSRKTQADVEIWRAVDIPLFTSGESKTIWANLSYGGIEAPATSITAQVSGTDFTGNTAADGSGTNKTSDFSVVKTNFASSAKLVFTYNGTGSAYLTLNKLRGTVITADEFTFAEDEDTTSQGTYGIRPLTIKSNWLQDINSAIDQAFVLKGQLAFPNQYPRVKIRGKPSKQFAMELFDVVNVSFATNGISDELRVGYISEEWDMASPNTVDTTIYFEPNLSGATSGTWIFPAVFGLSTVF